MVTNHALYEHIQNNQQCLYICYSVMEIVSILYNYLARLKYMLILNTCSHVYCVPVSISFREKSYDIGCENI